MTRQQLRSMVKEQWGEGDLHDGYNYAVFSLCTHPSHVDHLACYLRSKKKTLERRYREQTGERLNLLPDVALMRSRSVLIPVPYETSLNALSRVIETMSEDIAVSVYIPTWS